MSTPPNYPVVVHNVKEVSLYGRADLAYWRAHLQPEGLTPLDDHGQAELLLIAADMVWNGVRFTELSVSVALAQPGSHDQRAGMFLIQAFNSIRWFAWAERTFFQTPYYPAVTRVIVEEPVGFSLYDGETVTLQASLAAATPLASRGPETFAGPVYLPRALTRTSKAEKLFFAELSGETAIYTFAADDRLRLAASVRTPVVQWLTDSRFTGKEWHVRAAATHKKSQTQRASGIAATAVELAAS